MVVVMAKTKRRTDNDDLVTRARRDADALGRLYDLYYDRIYVFCLCRVFTRETAEDITSTVFLSVARGIGDFQGRTESDFGNWVYRIAANQANSYIRKASRRKHLLAEAARSMAASKTNSTEDPPQIDWPVLYAAIAKLKLKYQTVITLRFFQNLEYDQIARILKTRTAAVRVTLHRALKQLRNNLQTVLDGGN